VKLRDQEVIDDGGWSDIRQGRLFGVWGFSMVMVIRVFGVKEKKEAEEKKEVDLEHNSPHASGVFGRNHWREDDLSHHVQQMRGMEVVK